MLQVKSILDEKLIDNDNNIVELILSYITDKCDECKDRFFTNDLDYCYNNNNCKEDKYLCSVCKEDICCKECNYIDNELECCDDKDCNNMFCYDCEDKVVYQCSSCELKFCCRRFIRSMSSDGEYNYEYICEKCYDKPHFICGKYYKT